VWADTCLAYPAAPAAWEALRERGRIVSRARVRTGSRRVEMALLAIPLSGRVEGAATIVEELVRKAA